MRKYSVFRLYVIDIKGTKYICEQVVPGKIFKEVLTKRKFECGDECPKENFSEYYSIFERTNYTIHEQLQVTKAEILRKYLEINAPQEEDVFEETSHLATLISQALPNADTFYQQIGRNITIEEREYIKSELANNCDTCTNENCIVDQADKPKEDCYGWENDVAVGKYMVLKLNRRNPYNN